jgi:hypothetical protein
MKRRRRTRMKHQKQHRQRTAPKKHRSIRPTRNKSIAPRTAEEFFAKPQAFQDRWTRATHVISKMRADGVSLRRASREFGLDPRVVVRLAGSALRKRANGRYATKASDRLLRVLVLPTSEGLREVATRDSREASKAAEYWNAVHLYLAPGDASAVRQFDGKQITDANGKQVPLITDLNELSRIGSAGDFSFESLYARAS